MQHNHHLKSLLLGNNVVTDEGAKHIAEFIEKHPDHLDIWYIAGNEITGKGIAPVRLSLYSLLSLFSLFCLCLAIRAICPACALSRFPSAS
jgi:hypothetical protein